MKTTVYIDGYNFYYGCLKNTAYKWLDFYTLFNTYLIKPIEPNSELLQIKFFTSDIQARFSTSGQQAVNNQSTYLAAIQAYLESKFSVIKGKYSAVLTEAPVYKSPPDRKDTVKIWKLEEKQTDVSIALHVYRDVVQGECDQVVIVTNDTDMEPVIDFLRKDYPKIKIGVVIPRQEFSKRPISNSLVNKSDWHRSYILDNELINSQLPISINKPNGRGQYRKPMNW